MPRSSSRPSSLPSSPKSTTSISKPITSTQPSVNHNHQVQTPGFLSNMMQGFGLGAGQSIAMNMFRSDPKVTHIHETQSNIVQQSSIESKEYIQCMKESQNNKEACKEYLEYTT